MTKTVRLHRLIAQSLTALCALGSIGVGPALSADPASTAAQEADLHPFFRHGLLLQAGAMFGEVATSSAVGAASGPAASRFSFEDDFGYPSRSTRFDALLRWRMSKRWSFEFEYFDLPRSNTRTLTKTIEFGKYNYNSGITTSSTFDIHNYRLAMGYSFYKAANAEVGVAMSTYVGDLSASVAGQATLGGLSAGYQSQKFGLPVPLPAIGLYGSYALNRSWLISGRLDYMDLTLSSMTIAGVHLKDTGGRILSAELSATYQLYENIGIGVAYRFMDVATWGTGGSSGVRGEIDYRISSPIVFLRTSF